MDMNVASKIKKIKSYFENLSIEEFEKIAIEAGIDEIESSEYYDMELFDVDEINYHKFYTNENNFTICGEVNFDTSSIIYAEAV